MVFLILKILIYLAHAFLLAFTMELSKLINIENSTINLVKNKQTLFNLVYMLV